MKKIILTERWTTASTIYTQPRSPSGVLCTGQLAPAAKTAKTAQLKQPSPPPAPRPSGLALACYTEEKRPSPQAADAPALWISPAAVALVPHTSSYTAKSRREGKEKCAEQIQPQFLAQECHPFSQREERAETLQIFSKEKLARSWRCQR